MTAIPVVAARRRMTPVAMGPWGLAALAAAVLATQDALATEVPFESPSMISTSADDAFSVFAADVDDDGDMSAFRVLLFVLTEQAW